MLARLQLDDPNIVAKAAPFEGELGDFEPPMEMGNGGPPHVQLRYLEAPSAAKAKGTIMIVPEKTDVLVPEGGKGFCFVVSSLGGQKVNTLLQASNAEELGTWVTALRTAIGGGKPESKKAKPRRMSSMAAGATRGAAGGVIGGDRGSVRF